MNVKSNIAKAEFPEKLEPLFKKSRYKVLYGGRGGAKSWGVARALLIKGASEPLRVLCAREFQSSIRDSVHKLLCDQIESLNLNQFYEVTEKTIRGKNGTEFSFAGLKNNISNIKSAEGIDICWVEEAQTVSNDSWKKLTPTIRKKGSEIWVTLNPDLETDPTYQRFILNPPTDCILIKINWYDNPWFSQTTLKQEKDDLKERDLNEYNNVWEGICRQTVDGAIFAKELQQADIEGRICRVPYDPAKPVHAIFDLGWADLTAIWFLQFVGMETRLIRYMEDSQKTMSHYLSEMQKFGYVYDKLWLPHDAKNVTLGSNGKSIEDIVRAAGYKTNILEKVPVLDSINAARTIFGNCWFDRENCSDGINCLRHYRYEVDPDTKQFSKTPLHDQYSHGADAFRYIGLMLSKPKEIKRKVSRETNVSWMG